MEAVRARAASEALKVKLVRDAHARDAQARVDTLAGSHAKAMAAASLKREAALEAVRSRASSEVAKVKEAVERVAEEHERATLAKQGQLAARQDAASARRLELLQQRLFASPSKAATPATPRRAGAAEGASEGAGEAPPGTPVARFDETRRLTPPPDLAPPSSGGEMVEIELTPRREGGASPPIRLKLEAWTPRRAIMDDEELAQALAASLEHAGARCARRLAPKSAHKARHSARTLARRHQSGRDGSLRH